MNNETIIKRILTYISKMSPTKKLLVAGFAIFLIVYGTNNTHHNTGTSNTASMEIDLKKLSSNPKILLKSAEKQKLIKDNSPTKLSSLKVVNKEDLIQEEIHGNKNKINISQAILSKFKKSKKPETVENWQQVTVQSGDSLAKIFKSLNLPAQELQNLMSASKEANLLERLKPGQQIDFLIEEQLDAEFNNLKAVKLVINPVKTLKIESFEDSYKFDILTEEFETTFQYKQATITDSLFQSGRRAGIQQKLLLQLVDIFSWDIDFALDVRKNDVFRILYEEKYVNGKKIKSGDIVAAEFTNNDKTFSAIMHKDKFGVKRYYSPDGYSMQKAFIRTPVHFTRISSRFSLGRKHPVLHKIRAHRGVDYAAPTGTPIKASGNGKVKYIGWRGGYGKCIILQHGKEYTTLYGHLSRFAKIKKGTRVRQGQVIGYVGKTGLASGPHLHYEFRVNGVHKDPLKVKLPKSHPIPKVKLADFKTHAKKMLALIDIHRKSHLASNE